MINKTEHAIMKNWNNKSSITISITCVTYNQENYIRETLDSFLMQKTNFSFEILIHDDASTDRTQDILREYENRFPTIIKAVYQKNNQFSKGINPMSFLFNKVKGKYIAFCDGDDYWSDENKLQVQVEEMEKYPNIDMSFHPSYKFVNGSIDNKYLAKHSNKSKIFTPSEIILGGGEFCPTASLMFRSRLIPKLPEWSKRIIPGDFPIQIIGSYSGGGALYIDRVMSVYRVGAIGAWSNLSKDSSNIQEKRLLSFHNMLNMINRDFNNIFIDEVNEIIYKSSLGFIKRIAIDISQREEIFRMYKNIFPKKQKLLWYLFYKNKNLHNLLSQIKHKLSRMMNR